MSVRTSRLHFTPEMIFRVTVDLKSSFSCKVNGLCLESCSHNCALEVSWFWCKIWWQLTSPEGEREGKKLKEEGRGGSKIKGGREREGRGWRSDGGEGVWGGGNWEGAGVGLKGVGDLGVREGGRAGKRKGEGKGQGEVKEGERSTFYFFRGISTVFCHYYFFCYHCYCHCFYLYYFYYFYCHYYI